MTQGTRPPHFPLNALRAPSLASLSRRALAAAMAALPTRLGGLWYSESGAGSVCQAHRGMPRGVAAQSWRTLWSKGSDADGFIPLEGPEPPPPLVALCRRTIARHGGGLWIQPLAGPSGSRRGALVLGVVAPPTTETQIELDRIGRAFGPLAERLLQIDRLRMENHRLRVEANRWRETGQSRTSFISSLTHELKTPLNSIIGFTELLIAGYGGPLPESAREYLCYIKESGLRQLNLVKDLLSVTRLDSGLERVRPTQVSIERLVEQVAEMERQKYPEKGVTYHLEVTEDTRDLFLDGQLLRQLLSNLVNNAFKFSPPDSQIRIEAEVLPAPRPSPPSLHLAVRDRGIGIDPEDAGRLFQPFSQIDQSLARRYEGTGLGLYICRRICDLMGGTITFRSEPGHGTVFHVRLPLAARQG